MAKCETVVSPGCKQWRYHSIALSHKECPNLAGWHTYIHLLILEFRQILDSGTIFIMWISHHMKFNQYRAPGQDLFKIWPWKLWLTLTSGYLDSSMINAFARSRILVACGTRQNGKVKYWIFRKKIGQCRSCPVSFHHQGPLLQTWFNFNPSMDK